MLLVVLTNIPVLLVERRKGNKTSSMHVATLTFRQFSCSKYNFRESFLRIEYFWKSVRNVVICVTATRPVGELPNFLTLHLTIFPRRQLRANVTNGQKFGGNSSKINSAHILMLGRL